MRILLVPCLAWVSLTAQAPSKPTAEFFKQDPKILMALCSDEAKALAREGDAHFHAEYGELWLARGDRARAEAAFAHAVKVNPQDSQTHRLIGIAWLQHGHRAEALAAFQQARNLSHTSSWARPKNVITKVASDMVRGGFLPEATATMETAYSLDPKDTDNCLSFATAALAAGQEALARTYLERAAQAKPTDGSLWADIATLLGDHLVAERMRHQTTPAPAPSAP